MAFQMILRSGCLALGVLAGLPVFAQTTPPAPQTAPTQGIPEASRAPSGVPAPYRQPRATEVPAAQDDSANSPYRETAEDAQMNRMIRNICRGC